MMPNISLPLPYKYFCMVTPDLTGPPPSFLDLKLRLLTYFGSLSFFHTSVYQQEGPPYEPGSDQGFLLLSALFPVVMLQTLCK